MVAATDEYDAAYGRLRSRLLNSARWHGIHENDLEDVVHDALAKLLAEQTRPGAPALDVRGYTALHDKRVEYWRREERRRGRFTSLTLSPDEDGHEQERPEVASIDAALSLFELRELVGAIAGRDAMLFALLNACGATENDVAALLGWPPSRAAAARVQLARKKAQIALASLDTLD